MNDDELKDLIRDAANDLLDVSDIYYALAPQLSAQEKIRCNHLLHTAQITATWDGEQQ